MQTGPRKKAENYRWGNTNPTKNGGELGYLWMQFLLLQT
jgi:hypothetical protein